MKKKAGIIVLIILFLLLIIGGIFYLRKSNKPIASADVTAVDIANDNKTVPKEAEIEIPKIEKYKVPILMYHYIRIADEGDELGKNLSVTPENFNLQMKWLKENNYETLTLAEFTQKDKKVLSKIIFDKKNPIILTFDDGYEDAYTQALPILKENNFTGTFFVIRNYVGKPEYMNLSQINKMTEAGMEIGSHTLSHPNLVSLDANRARSQIADSKGDSETFCYPAGKYDATIANLVEEAGYVAAVTTKFGIANQDSNIFELPRLRIFDSSGESLGEKISDAME